MNRNVHKLIGQKLSKSSVCYVLITCEEANADGDMQVEMTYEGDAALASYLLQGAQNAIDDQDEEEKCCQRKILSIGG
ncbi:MAG: hypothetical protein LLG04_02945 [Parachlamydia sp.]|nr:hypothetical protein [Parachlamydia sp.]